MRARIRLVRAASRSNQRCQRQPSRTHTHPVPSHSVHDELPIGRQIAPLPLQTWHRSVI
jgi:hypothetical protein